MGTLKRCLSRLFQTKFISLNVYADPRLNFDERVGNLNDAGVGGLNLDVDYNFTLPPDYSSGTPLTLRILAYARDAPCSTQLSANWVYVSRAGSPEISDGTSTLTPSNIDRNITTSRVAEEFVFMIDNSVPLLAGDSVSFGLFGFGPLPRCDCYQWVVDCLPVMVRIRVEREAYPDTQRL